MSTPIRLCFNDLEKASDRVSLGGGCGMFSGHTVSSGLLTDSCVRIAGVEFESTDKCCRTLACHWTPPRIQSVTCS